MLETESQSFSGPECVARLQSNIVCQRPHETLQIYCELRVPLSMTERLHSTASCRVCTFGAFHFLHQPLHSRNEENTEHLP